MIEDSSFARSDLARCRELRNAILQQYQEELTHQTIAGLGPCHTEITDKALPQLSAGLVNFNDKSVSK